MDLPRRGMAAAAAGGMGRVTVPGGVGPEGPLWRGRGGQGDTVPGTGGPAGTGGVALGGRWGMRVERLVVAIPFAGAVRARGVVAQWGRVVGSGSGGGGGAQPKPEPKHTHLHRTPQPGMAGNKGGTHTSTHTAQHPSQEWRGAAETRAQTHTPTARIPARSGGVQAERPDQHTHSPTPQAGVAGRSENPSPNTNTHGAHPSQEWRGASRAPTPAHTQPNTPARSGGAQPRPEPKHTHPRRAPQRGVVGCKRSAHTSTHTPQH